MRKHRSSKLVSRTTLLSTILASDFHREQQPLVKGFVKRDVIIKASKYTIQGRLMYADSSKQHRGLGNLVLEDGSIIRGNLVYAVCTEER